MREPETGRIREHLEAIIGERNPRTSIADLQRAGEYLEHQFRSWNLPVELDPVTFEGTSTFNVLARKEGTGGSDDLFILGAHYDTVEGSPGADDNASAVASLLEVARCLEPVPLKNTLLFAGFTLEECGFIGSGQFAGQVKKKNQPLLGMIALEMLGCRKREPGSQSYPPYVDPGLYPDTGDFIAVVGNGFSAELTRTMAETMRRKVPQLPVEELIVPGRGDGFSEVRLSDHSPFWDLGYSAVMVTDTAFFRNDNYHRPTDKLETLDVEFIRDVTAAIAGFLESYLA